MSGNDRVRFCDHCQLNVYNISELTQLETESLIASTEGRLCARLFHREDGTIITSDCPVGLRTLRKRVSKRVAVIFATIAAISSSAPGQQSSTKNEKRSKPLATKITIGNSSWNQIDAYLAGIVVDFNGQPIQEAEINIEGDGNLEKKFWTDAEGRFKADPLRPGTYSITVGSPGFQLYKRPLLVEQNQLINIDVVLEVGHLGEIVFVEDPIRFESKPGTAIIKGDISKKVPIQ